jgi:hypothetical protein
MVCQQPTCSIRFVDYNELLQNYKMMTGNVQHLPTKCISLTIDVNFKTSVMEWVSNPEMVLNFTEQV